MTNLSVAELERMVASINGLAPGVPSQYVTPATLARVCRHALALEAEVARLRRQVEGQRHEVHEDDGDA